MNLLLTLSSIFSLFAIVVVGFVVYKLEIASERFAKDVSQFLFYISIPCTMVNSISQNFSQDILNGALKMLAYSVGFIVLGIFLGRLWLQVIGEKDVRKRPVYEFTLTISNYGFMGWPICYALFGDTGLFYSSVFAIPINIIFYIYGGMVFGRNKQVKGKTNWRSFISPPVIGTFIGLILFLTRIQLPELIGNTVSMLGATTIPLAMAVAGMMLATNSVRNIFGSRKVFIYAAIRLLIMPAAVALILKMMGETGLMLAIPVTIAAMPAPPNVTVLTEAYEADSFLAAQVIFISTLLSVLTISLVTAFL